jgi:urease accessory protein
LCVQKPFYPGDGACHVYVLHPPGGLAGGDVLDLDVSAGTRAAALVTTPASTKFYRTRQRASVQSTRLRAADGASLEWLPTDTILFGGSRAEIDTHVSLAAGARFIGWDVTSLGRPLSGDAYETGSVTQRFRLDVDAEPVLLERLELDAGARLRVGEWGLAGAAAWGAMYVYPATGALLDAARDHAECAAGPVLAGATLLGRLLVLRCLASRAGSVRALFESLWAAVRTDVTGLASAPPRIWKT